MSIDTIHAHGLESQGGIKSIFAPKYGGGEEQKALSEEQKNGLSKVYFMKIRDGSNCDSSQMFTRW